MILASTDPTGKLGSRGRLFAERHLPTRALVRAPSRAPKVEIVTGDVDHPDTLAATTRAVDTVLLISPSVPRIQAHLTATELAYPLLGPNLRTMAPMSKQTRGFPMSAGDGHDRRRRCGMAIQRCRRDHR